MKKLLALAVVAAVAYFVYREFIEDREERDLWAEVTDDLN
jgi:hypothetical protein